MFLAHPCPWNHFWYFTSGADNDHNASYPESLIHSVPVVIVQKKTILGWTPEGNSVKGSNTRADLAIWCSVNIEGSHYILVKGGMNGVSADELAKKQKSRLPYHLPIHHLPHSCHHYWCFGYHGIFDSQWFKIEISFFHITRSSELVSPGLVWQFNNVTKDPESTHLRFCLPKLIGMLPHGYKMAALVPTPSPPSRQKERRN